ncbi:MAG: hypothetical protein KatS3mg095_0698 [Candidatus Parcubacteria bacterium]|nr:MAG: hypothetical protein KatS3mg095_0698 [Candidatus Parcubacteria bacterium]
MNRFEKQLVQSLIKNKNVWEVISDNDLDLLNFLEINKNNKKLKIDRDKLKIIRKINNFNCPNCDGRGLIIDPFFKDILNKFEEIIKNRPKAIPQYDQAFIKPEDVVRRVEFIHERGDLLNSKILVIGDDDLISIVLGLTKLPKIIYVVEIDQRITSFINNIAKKFNIKVKSLKYDVRTSLPKNLLSKFDVFITDPVETEKGLKIFLLRGMLSLKQGGSGYFGLTTLESSLKKWYKIEKFILNNGFVITDIKRKFSVYPITKDENSWMSFKEKLPIYNKLKDKNNYDWYTSSFIRIEKIKIAKIKNKRITIGKFFYIDPEALATPRI